MSICQSNAIKEFGLSKKDLDDLVYVEKRNPVYRKAAPMKMYDREDLVKKFCEKHKIDEADFDNKLAEIIEKRNAKEEENMDRIKTRQENEQRERKKNIMDKLMMAYIDPHIINTDNDPIIYSYINDGYINDNDGNTIRSVDNIVAILERKSKLIFELSKQNLFMRDDSKLCHQYIYHNDHNPKYVVDIMVGMDWLFEKTNYKTILNNIMDENRKLKLYKSGEECSNDAKKQVLMQWIKNTNNISPPSCFYDIIKNGTKGIMRNEIKEMMLKLDNNKILNSYKNNKYVSYFEYVEIAKQEIEKYWIHVKVDEFVNKYIDKQIDIAYNLFLKEMVDETLGLTLPKERLLAIYKEKRSYIKNNMWRTVRNDSSDV